MPRSLSDYRVWIDRLRPWLVRDVTVVDEQPPLQQVFRQHPQLLIILNHGPMLGPVPVLLAVADQALQAGGEERRPFGITWRGFYKIPVYRRLIQWLTQVGAAVSVDKAVELLADGSFTDCCIMPEGELCNVGNGVDVQPFLSPRFVEVAVRAGVPVLLVAHHGAGQLGRPLPVDPALLGLFRWMPGHLFSALQRSRTLSIPWLLQPRVKRLWLSFELCELAVGQEDLEAADAGERIDGEARRLRARLQMMVNRLILAAEGD
ncbi:lysophospholipid acyltransferase family protein [Mangrovitalea sediminis]|uniref:hypothetical protein n=1 Tax=Mangrovitalea sediminis TaxID=1982043 RepID=UPI000BE532A2|nr:hypothetical protein [Mangrovitalea sediminis]